MNTVSSLFFFENKIDVFEHINQLQNNILLSPTSISAEGIRSKNKNSPCEIINYSVN